jgi:hypothetical protein
MTCFKFEFDFFYKFSQVGHILSCKVLWAKTSFNQMPYFDYRMSREASGAYKRASSSLKPARICFLELLRTKVTVRIHFNPN